MSYAPGFMFGAVYTIFVNVKTFDVSKMVVLLRRCRRGRFQTCVLGFADPPSPQETGLPGVVELKAMASCMQALRVLGQIIRRSRVIQNT